jgi:hypothetical protein
MVPTHPWNTSPPKGTWQHLVAAEQSDVWLQSGSVSVAKHDKEMLEGQLAVVVQVAPTDEPLHDPRFPPLRTAVAQHVGVVPLQSEG